MNSKSHAIALAAMILAGGSAVYAQNAEQKTAPAVSQEVQKAAQNLFGAARDKANAKDFAAAISLYRDVIKAQGASIQLKADSYFLIARILADNAPQKYEEAITELENGLKLEGLSAQSRFAFIRFASDLKQRLGNPDYNGAVAFQMQIANDSSADGNAKADAYVAAARIYSSMPRPDYVAAIDALSKALAIADLKAARRFDLRRMSADFMMKLQKPDVDSAVKLMKQTLDDKDADASLKAEALLVAARILNTSNHDAAIENIQTAMKLEGVPVAKRNDLRRNAAEMKIALAKPDYDGAIIFLKQACDDKEADAKTKVAANLMMARVLSSGKTPLFDAANAVLDNIKKMDGATPGDIITASKQLAANKLALKKPDFDGAITVFETIASDKDASNQDRLDAMRKIAESMLRRGDKIKDVKPVYERMWTLEKLNANDVRFIAELHGRFIQGTNDFDGARKIFAKVLETDSSDAAKNVVANLTAGTWKAEGDVDKAFDSYMSAGNFFAAVTLLAENGRLAKANEMLQKAIEDNSQDSVRIIEAIMTINSFDEARKLAEKAIAKTAVKNPSVGNALLRKLKTSMEYGAYDFAVWAAPIVMNSPKLNPVDYTFAVTYYINALAQLNKNAEAKKAIAAASIDKLLASDSDRFRFTLLKNALETNSADAAFNSCKKTGSEFNGVNIPMSAIAKAGATALMLNNKPVAEGIEKYRTSHLVDYPRQKADCKFVDNAPSDISEWMNSKYVKDNSMKNSLSRPAYEENIEFLLATDAAITSRGVTAGSNAKVETEFYTVCDKNGVHIFLLAHDDNAKDIVRGIKGGGSYEGYLAPGEFQPYHCFIVDFYNGKTFDFVSAYPGPMSRRPTIKDGQIKAETRLVDDKTIATYLFYPWDSFYNTLPDNPGDAWQFDVIRWTGSGFSWSGTKSVHNRSTWGDLKFNITPKQLTEIRREIIYKALPVFKDERSGRGGQGVFSFWNDQDLGDQEFYKAKLAPLVDKLESYVKLVTPDMSDATVNELFLKAVPEWVNVKYTVSDMRQEWLAEKWFEEKKK